MNKFDNFTDEQKSQYTKQLFETINNDGIESVEELYINELHNKINSLQNILHSPKRDLRLFCKKNKTNEEDINDKLKKLKLELKVFKNAIN